MELRDLAAVAGTLVSVFVSVFLLLFTFCFMSGKQGRAAEDRARERRMAEHRMNARLLKLNI